MIYTVRNKFPGHASASNTVVGLLDVYKKTGSSGGRVEWYLRYLKEDLEPKKAPRRFGIFVEVRECASLECFGKAIYVFTTE